MMIEPGDDGVILRLEPSPSRRAFAIGVLYVLGALLLLIAFSQPAAPGWTLFLVVMGALAALGGELLRRATARTLELTVEGLFDSGGRCLARWDDIDRIDRGAFAFKPSNGFLIVLRSPGPRGWAPGLWWQLGRRVGVGGVTPRQAARFMAETISRALSLADCKREPSTSLACMLAELSSMMIDRFSSTEPL